MTGARGRLRPVLAALALGWRATRLGTLATVVLALLTGAAPAVVAWLGKLLIDELTLGRVADPGRAVGLALGAALAAGVLAAAGHLSAYLAIRVQQAVTIRVEEELNQRVDALVGMRYFEDPVFHDRLRLADQGAQGAPAQLTDFALELVRRGIGVAAFVVALLAVWPPMALLLVVAAVPAFITQLALARRFAQSVEAMTATHRRRFYYRSLNTDAAAAKEIRLYGLGALFRGRMVAALTESSNAELAVHRRSALAQSAYSVLNAMVAGVGAAVVVRGAVRGEVTIGDVSLFLAAVGSLQGAFTGVIMQFGQLTEAMRLFAHYLDLLDAPADLPDGTAPVPALTGGIELRDVWFRYDPGGPWALRGVNLTIPHGSAMGLVGLNGAGKSTLVKLVCRLYDPERGQILWDGVDIREFAAAELRRRIAVTFQDFMTYDLTVGENIGIGDLPRRDDLDQVRRSAELARIHEKIAGLPDGYGSLLSRMFFAGDEQAGVMFSGGEKQRVALARSVMRTDADLLILDEPSSGLDAAAEYEINQALRVHRAGRSSLLVSHRLSALRDADQIVVLADGEIVERGSHDVLMAAGGEYARLFGLQAAGYQDERVAGAPPTGGPIQLPPGFDLAGLNGGPIPVEGA